jgi:hypothetical protein
VDFPDPSICAWLLQNLLCGATGRAVAVTWVLARLLTMGSLRAAEARFALPKQLSFGCWGLAMKRVV